MKLYFRTHYIYNKYMIFLIVIFIFIIAKNFLQYLVINKCVFFLCEHKIT